LIDSGPHAALESRALGIQAKTLELFQNIGLIQTFLKLGMRAEGVELHLNKKRRMSVDMSDMARPDTPYPFIFMLSQSETERILIEALKEKSVEVRRRHTLVAFRQDPASFVTAEIETPSGVRELIQAKYLVGCDGAHSAVRKLLGLAFKGNSYASEFIMADAMVHGDLPLNKVSVFIETGAVAVLFPIQGNKMSRVLTVRQYTHHSDEPATDATTASPATLQEVEENFNRVSGKEIRLTDPQWVTRFHVHHRSVEKTQIGRIFLAGDASHIHSPVGAQGMNTGMQDAANLAWKLALALKSPAAENLLATYHSERWPVGQRLLKFTDRIFTLAITKNWVLTSLRNILLPTVTRWVARNPSGKKWAFGFISELRIRYHKSDAVREHLSLAASTKFKNTLPAGYRAPNAKVSQDLELFDLIKDYQFHVLVFSKGKISTADQKNVQNWIRSKAIPGFQQQLHWISLERSAETAELFVHQARTEEVFDLYGVDNQAIFLIRPDGYVGFRSDTLNL
jgi:2-polyprenyl-6-methoxyphenol hydroxylase-like FAD-dependent oxidoreductase